MYGEIGGDRTTPFTRSNHHRKLLTASCLRPAGKMTKVEDKSGEKQVQVCRVASGLARHLYLGVFLFYVTLQVIQAGPTATAQGADVIARIVGQVMILCVRHDPTAYFAFASIRVRQLFEIVRQINFLNVRKRRALSALRC